ncbi:MAG: riboflavin kinase, partial [Bacteroidota bacterium]
MKIENYKLISSLNDAPVMITVGMFDGVHRGHRYFVREMTKEAKKRKLIPVIVTMYPHPKEILSDKEFRYLTSLPEKKHYMKQLGIEHVLVLKTTKSLLNSAADEFINALQSAGLNIKAIAMGYNNNFGKKLDEKVNFEAVVKRKGISLFTVPAFSETVNSTLVREKLLHGKVDDAAALLGHPYVLFGHVVEGNKIGRGMGYPTANIKVDSIEKMIPAVGVYAVKCHVNDAV